MTLVNPNWWERLPILWKAIIGGAVGLVLIGAVLFGAKSCSNWRTDRQIDKAKANVNAALANLANAQANVQKDAIEVAQHEQAVKDAANAVLVASNASVAVQTNTNAMLSNLNRTIAANRPIGTTAQQINDQLKDLDGE